MKQLIAPLPVLFTLLCVAASEGAVDHRHIEDATLHDIQFIDGKEGWAVGDEGVIWHTIDGGKKWYAQKTDIRASLRSVWFLSSQVGWVAGRKELAGGKSTGVVLFTKDGGAKWHLISINKFPGLNKIQFLDLRTGFMLSDGTQDLPSGLFQTTDRGRKWRPVAGPRSPGWLDGDFQDKNTGALTGAWSRLSVLRNGTLQPANVDELGGRNMRGMRLLAGGRAVAVGDGGLVLVSKTSGSGWGYAKLKIPARVLANVDFRAVDAKKDDIWVVGRPGSIILHSGDQGKTWEMQKTNQPLPLNGVHFYSTKKGWAVGALGTILSTTDGGATWQVQRSGGGRAALLFAHAHANSLPAESLAQLGLDDGYLIAGLGVISSDPKSAALFKAAEENRFAAAARRAGGAAGEILWQFPLPEHHSRSTDRRLIEHWNKLHNRRAADEMLRQLVLALRIWRPTVVVTDAKGARASASLVGQAMTHACKLAADKTAFAEQLQNLSLRPWQVSKLYVQGVARDKAHVTMDGNKFSMRLGGVPHDYVVSARALLSESKMPHPRLRYFRLEASTLPQAARQTSLTIGLEAQAGKDARRMLPPLTKIDLARLAKIRKTRRQLQALTQQQIKGLTEAPKVSALLGRLLAKLPQEQGAPAAFAIARKYVHAGQWPLAQQAFLTMVDHYPTHSLSAEAYRWLIQHNSSSEVRRRYELKQFMLEDVSKTEAPKFPTPEQLRKIQLKQKKKTGRSTKKAPGGFPLDSKTTRQLFKGSSVSGMSRMNYLTNHADQARWYKNSLESAKRLAGFGPLYMRDPFIQFPLQAARRQLGEFKQARDWYTSYKAASNPASPWWKAAAAELWLGSNVARPPKPTLICRYSPTRPFLDGKFADPCWQGLAPTPLQSAAGKTAKSHKTQVRMAYDGDFLYIALTCTHPAAHYAAPAKKRGRDADLRSYDRVRLLFDLDRDYCTYFDFQVDQRGCVFEECWGDRTWNPRWFVAVRSSKTAWNIEAAIPLGQLTGQTVSANSAWACNFVRVMPGRGVQAFSTPASVVIRPENMGLMLFREAARRSRIHPVSTVPKSP